MLLGSPGLTDLVLQPPASCLYGPFDLPEDRGQRTEDVLAQRAPDGSPPLHRGASTCPARTACRELTPGTGDSVASCWWRTEACTATTQPW